MEAIVVPLHFISTFVVAVAAAGCVWMAVSRPHLVPRRLARLGFGAGWALLAAAETAHGSLLVGGEVDQTTMAMRAGAYALLVLSLLGRVDRQAAPAAPVFAPAALMPSFLSAAAAWLSLRSGLEDRRRLALAFVLIAGSEVAVGLGGDIVGTRPDFFWFLSHGLRLGAGLAIGAWIWHAFRTSLQLRFVASFVGLLLLVVVLISSAMTQVFAGNLREAALEGAAREGEAHKLLMDQQIREAVRESRQVADSPEVRRAVAQRDPILGELAARLEGPGGVFETADFLVFLAPAEGAGLILAYSASGRQDEPPRLDEVDATSLAGTDVVVSALGGIQAGSIDVIGVRKFLVAAAFPVLNPPGFDPPGAPIGVAGAVAMGRVIDESYLAELRARSGLEFSVITPEDVVATTLPGFDGIVLPGLDEVFEGRQSLAREITVAGEDFFSAYIPLERTDRKVAGALVVSQPSEVLVLTQRNVGSILFLMAFAATATALALSYVSGSRITRPILDLTRAAERVRRGDLEARVDVSHPDEVGALGGAFNEMTASISQLTVDLRQAAEEEFELRSRLETILESMTDGVVAVDANASVAALNREAARILGRRSEKVLGRPVKEVLQVLDPSGSPIELPIYSLRRGQAVSGMVVGRGNGRRTPVAVNSAPIEDEEGTIVGAVAVVRDLTPELEVERMKTEFLSNISHELRTPLTPIKGYADILRRRNIPRSKAVAYLDSMIDSIDRLERIVEMLIDVSSMEAGRLALNTESIDMEKSTSDLLERWKRVAPKHRFQRRGFKKLPPIDIDERLIGRAINELIDNAVKFSPKGGRVGLAAGLEDSRNGSVARISVSDQGVGISDETVSEMFADFVQADASATREFGGLGLGLAYVRRVVEAHGGTIEAEKLSGKGSRFSIVLPAGEAIISSRRRPAPRAKAKAKSARPKKTAPRRASSTTPRKSIKKKRNR